MSALAAAGLPERAAPSARGEMRDRSDIGERARPHLQAGRALPVAAFHRVARRDAASANGPATNGLG